MNTKRARKYNMRRTFFNKEKGQQCQCGALKIDCTPLTGEITTLVCPINHGDIKDETIPS